MVYRILGGITFVLMGLVAFGVSIPHIIVGVCALIAGVALLAGI